MLEWTFESTFLFLIWVETQKEDDIVYTNLWNKFSTVKTCGLQGIL